MLIADVGNGSESSVGDRVSVSNLGAVQSLIGVQLRVSALTFHYHPLGWFGPDENAEKCPA